MRSFRFVLLAALAAVTFTSAPAKAGLLLEPYIGYGIGTIGEGAGEGDLKAPYLGARVGMTFPILFLAADYMMPVGGEVEDADLDGGGDLFAVVGASLPLLRAYAGYGFVRSLKFDGGGELEDGNAIKLGVGTTILPFVAINFEYITGKYEEGSAETDSSLMMLSASVPFDL